MPTTKSETQQYVDEITRLVNELAAKTVVPAKPAVPPSNQKKLTKREVARIRELKRNGFTQKQIADIFDCNPATVSRIIRGIYWR